MRIGEEDDKHTKHTRKRACSTYLRERRGKTMCPQGVFYVLERR